MNPIVNPLFFYFAMEVAKYATPDNIKSIITEIVSTVKEMTN